MGDSGQEKPEARSAQGTERSSHQGCQGKDQGCQCPEESGCRSQQTQQGCDQVEGCSSPESCSPCWWKALRDLNFWLMKYNSLVSHKLKKKKKKKKSTLVDTTA